jgi:hypothetical protein
MAKCLAMLAHSAGPIDNGGYTALFGLFAQRLGHRREIQLVAR